MIDGIVEFFRKGQHGDMIFFKIGGGFWSSAWTMAAHDPSNAGRLADQYVKMGADGLRHCERVVLQAKDGTLEDVAVVTDLPLGRQTVIGIVSGEEKKLRHRVQTETLTAITSAIKALVTVSAK